MITGKAEHGDIPGEELQNEYMAESLRRHGNARKGDIILLQGVIGGGWGGKGKGGGGG